MGKGPINLPSRTVLGTAPCRVAECDKTVTVKVNSGGWPYAFCVEPNGGCGDANPTKGKVSARALVGRITSWHSKSRREACAVLLDGAAPKLKADPKPKPAPEPEPDDDGEETDDEADYQDDDETETVDDDGADRADDDGGKLWWE
jgi:hypothetical protein